MTGATKDFPTLNPKPLGTGRALAYAAFGAAAVSVPLPWLPEAFVRRVRGALAQDITARHGLSLSPEAREVLTAPVDDERQGPLAAGLRYMGRRLLGRIGPLGVLPPVRAALETFALGHLLARYLSGGRTSRAARIDEAEARALHRAMASAFARALGPDIKSEVEEPPLAPDDARDALTQAVDGFLMSAAALPTVLVQRLEAAFDQATLAAGLVEPRAEGAGPTHADADAEANPQRP